jgi:NADPH:quinone reductase-like Zn-dependent oxidoreductase
MKAINQETFGGPEVLQLVDIPEPAPRPGRARVRVTAAAVNPVDVAARAGWLRPFMPDLTPPFVLGSEFAGVVIDGDGPYPPGTRVAGLAPWYTTHEGTYAEVISVDPAWLARIPDALDDVTAASVPLTSQTASQSLDLLGLQAGQTVLITGASGSVGGFAVQLAAQRGARVLAVSSADDDAYVSGLGAERVLPRTGTNAELAAAVKAVAPGGVDAVFDPGSLGAAVVGTVRDGGVFVAVNASAAPQPERGVDVRDIGAQSDGQLLARLLDAVAAKTLTTRVGATVPLAEAARAHTMAASHSVSGKIVLTT